MLPRLLDSAGFQTAANMTPDDFANAALAGMVPRAVGTLGNVPLWSEHIVQTFCKEVGREFNSEWRNGNGAASAAPLVVSALANAVQSNAQDDANAAVDWPEEMSQVMAARYCDTSTSFLEKNAALLNPRKERGFVIYKKDDLDTFMQLPIYKMRKRKGYTAGKPNGKAINGQRLVKPAPTEKEPMGYASGFTLLTEKAAADHLGMHPDTLALARKDGIGPACTTASGSPRYRVADLDAWKQEQTERTASVQPANTTQTELDTVAAAEYLGVTRDTLQWWRRNGSGPACIRHNDNPRAHVFYAVAELEQFKRTHQHSIEHSQRMRANPNVAGPYHNAARAKGKSASSAAKKQRQKTSARATTRVHPAGTKSVTPSGSRLRH